MGVIPAYENQSDRLIEIVVLLKNKAVKILPYRPRSVPIANYCAIFTHPP